MADQDAQAEAAPSTATSVGADTQATTASAPATAEPAVTTSRTASAPKRRAQLSTTRTKIANWDATQVRDFMAFSNQDVKRSKAYAMMQELQMMVCSKDNGIRGNAARARSMVLMKEVQGVLIALENSLDAVSFDVGVMHVERTELRKELRDERGKEQLPLHTIDYRTTDVKELPHKMRALFEDNQVLREQVRVLQYQATAAQSKAKVAESKALSLEVENARLGVALQAAGLGADHAEVLRCMREDLRAAESRAAAVEQQMVGLLAAAEQDREAAAAQIRAANGRAALLESKLKAALGLAVGSRLNSVVVPGARSKSVSSALQPSRKRPSGESGADDAGALDVGMESSANTMSYAQYASGASYSYPSASAGDFEGTALSYVKAYGAVGASMSTARSVSSSARRRSPSPPKPPGRSTISHNPGSSIPSLYPTHNLRASGPAHSFSPEYPTWHGGGGASAVAASPPGTSQLSGIELLQGGRGAKPVTPQQPSGPAETVRAINSSAVVTSRTLLPSMSGSGRSHG